MSLKKVIKPQGKREREKKKQRGTTKTARKQCAKRQ